MHTREKLTNVPSSEYPSLSRTIILNFKSLKFGNNCHIAWRRFLIWSPWHEMMNRFWRVFFFNCVDIFEVCLTLQQSSTSLFHNYLNVFLGYFEYSVGFFDLLWPPKSKATWHGSTVNTASHHPWCGCREVTRTNLSWRETGAKIPQCRI